MNIRSSMSQEAEQCMKSFFREAWLFVVQLRSATVV